MIRIYDDARIRDASSAVQLLRSRDGALYIAPSDDGPTAIYREGESKPLAIAANKVSAKDVALAQAYKDAAFLRWGSTSEPVDLTEEGLSRANDYFRSGRYSKTLRFLGLIPNP